MDKKVVNGKLYLIPAPLGDVPATSAVPDQVIDILASLKHFIVEEVRTARRFLKKAVPAINIDSLTFHVFNEHTDRTDLSGFLIPLHEGHDIGLLSEAGLPCIADPGAEIVKLAHERNIRVIPLTGPSSLLLALVASGFNGQNFTFHGYLPVDRQERKRKLKELERASQIYRQTQIFIETPYRNIRMFEAIVESCMDSTLLCIAAGITTENEYIRTKNVKEWKRNPPPIEKIPAVFLLYSEK